MTGAKRVTHTPPPSSPGGCGSSCHCGSCRISLPEFGTLSYRRLNPGNVFHFLDTILFECVPPLALIGTETATCMANGTWSSIPVCKGE